MGIALALPMSFYALLQNATGVSQHWNNNSTQISVYLKTNLSKLQTDDLLHQLRTNPEIANVTYISPEQGLKEFSKVIGGSKAISTLQKNPLPGVVLIQPILSLNTSLELSQLVTTLKRLPEVDKAQFDLAWLNRLHKITHLVNQCVLAIGLLLALAIILIVGYAIHLATQNEQQEIAVLKLVGATNAFIRRPFLYIGIWYGLLSGIVAWLLITLILWWLQTPVSQLAASYNSSFYLHNLTAGSGITLIIGSMLLGLAGSWLISHKELR